MKKTKMHFLNVGGVSVIMIFMVLCLSMLGVLAVSSAYGDFRLTERYRDNTVLYYSADANAQQKLFDIQQALDNTEMIEKKELEDMINSSLTNQADKYYGGFIEPMGEKQGLEVKLILQKQAGNYTVNVNSYKVIRTTEETYTSTWNLWDGTLPE